MSNFPCLLETLLETLRLQVCSELESEAPYPNSDSAGRFAPTGFNAEPGFNLWPEFGQSYIAKECGRVSTCAKKLV